MIRLVPLGAWCRTAHQTRVYAETREDVSAATLPYDWMITSFAALRRTLDPDFDPYSVLQPEHAGVSQFQSGICNTTGIIFHHAISPNQLQRIGTLAPGDILPDTEAAQQLVQSSRERFQHTYQTLNGLKSETGPLVFVRWQRFGHPDVEFSEAFEGETPETLSAAIAAFLGHDDFHLLVVQTERAPSGGVIANPVAAFETDARVITARIRERPGWNGRKSPNFRGDEPSWRTLFNRALDNWGLG